MGDREGHFFLPRLIYFFNSSYPGPQGRPGPEDTIEPNGPGASPAVSPHRQPLCLPRTARGQRVDIAKQAGRSKRAASLPKDFRPLHGLRHSFAPHLNPTPATREIKGLGKKSKPFFFGVAVSYLLRFVRPWIGFIFGAQAEAQKNGAEVFSKLHQAVLDGEPGQFGVVAQV